MLRERGSATSDLGGRVRRRFVDEEFELHVFLEPDGTMFGFQLAYALGPSGWLLSWTPVERYMHFRLEAASGGFDPWDARRDMTPTDPGAVDCRALLRRLQPAAAGLEPHIRSFVLELLFSHAEEARRCRYCAERRQSGWHCGRCWLRACDRCMERKTLRKSRCTWTEAEHDWQPEAGSVWTQS